MRRGSTCGRPHQGDDASRARRVLDLPDTTLFWNTRNLGSSLLRMEHPNPSLRILEQILRRYWDILGMRLSDTQTAALRQDGFRRFMDEWLQNLHAIPIPASEDSPRSIDRTECLRRVFK